MKDQLFADYMERLEDLQHRLQQDVGALPAAAIDWSPGEKMNPVAVLLAHITGVLREGVDLALANPPTRVRAQEFQTRGGGAPSCYGAWTQRSTSRACARSSRPRRGKEVRAWMRMG